MDREELNKFIRNYPDFPKPGIVFRDISPLIANPGAFKSALSTLIEEVGKMAKFDKILAIDARGFIFGGALADRMNKGLIMCRKSNKLPGKLVTKDYGYEYSSDSLSIQKDAIKSGDKILILDDVLASGNTLLVAAELIKKLGGEVSGILCFLELKYLDGRNLLSKNLKDIDVRTIVELQR